MSGAHVIATVVRAQRPSSVRPGDTATIRPDGTIEGFVGGVCAEQSVRLHALRALETGEALLLRIVPEGEDPHQEGAVTVANPCISGGGMEIFLRPVLPAPVLGVTGATPVAEALRELAPRIGFELGSEGEAAVVVASHGRDEIEVLARALEAGVPYVGLVASRKRGEAVRAAVGPGGERIHTPAGLDIGARTPAEIALSILAQIVAERRAAPPVETAPAAQGAQRARTAIDPVCGMEVAIGPDTPELDGHWFCCEGCRASYAAQHAAH